MPRTVREVLLCAFAVGLSIFVYVGWRGDRREIFRYVADIQGGEQGKKSPAENKPLFPKYEPIVMMASRMMIVGNLYCLNIRTGDGYTSSCFNHADLQFLNQLIQHIRADSLPPDFIPPEIKQLIPNTLEEKFQYFLLEKRDGYNACAVKLLKTPDEKGMCTTLTNAWTIMLLQVDKFGEQLGRAYPHAHKSIISAEPLLPLPKPVPL